MLLDLGQKEEVQLYDQLLNRVIGEYLSRAAGDAPAPRYLLL